MNGRRTRPCMHRPARSSHASTYPLMHACAVVAPSLSIASYLATLGSGQHPPTCVHVHRLLRRAWSPRGRALANKQTDPCPPVRRRSIDASSLMHVHTMATGRPASRRRPGVATVHCGHSPMAHRIFVCVCAETVSSDVTWERKS